MKSLTFLILSLITVSAYGENRLDSLLSVLDAEVRNFSRYEREENGRIAKIRNRYEKADPTSKESYELCRTLFERYRRLNADSARHYLRKCVEWSAGRKDAEREKRDKLDLAFYYASTGMYAETCMLMRNIGRPSSREALGMYYITYSKLYEELYWESRDPLLKERYGRLRRAYGDSMVVAGIHPQDDYWWHKTDSLFKAGNGKACVDMLNEYPQDDRTHALLAYIIAQRYEAEGDTLSAMAYYTQASIADIRSVTKDHGALPLLCKWLLDHGDVNRAYQYINFSWSLTTSFGSRLRYLSNMGVLNLIESTYKKMLIDKQRTLRVFTIAISGLSVLLCLLLILVIVQFKKLNKVKNKLSDSNNTLLTLNRKNKEINLRLKEINEKLSLSNDIKEKYLTHFMQLCSSYIHDMESYQRKLKRLIMKGDTQEALRFAEASSLFEKEIDSLYKSFDQAFLHIFPHFVEQFNELLQDGHKITLKKNELLSTELRIFALIKLGVTDFTQIAQFLRCSVNTIYNYRAKIKSHLCVSKEEFDERLLN